MFASKIQKEVTVSDGAITVRKLSFSKLDRARDVRQLKSATTIKGYGGEVVKVLRDESTADLAERIKARQSDPEAARKARYAEYDRMTVLHEGIVKWSYDEAPDEEHINDLDDADAQTTFEAIIDLSAPPPEVKKEEQAKG